MPLEFTGSNLPFLQSHVGQYYLRAFSVCLPNVEFSSPKPTSLADMNLKAIISAAIHELLFPAQHA